jgi:hypothetical protein
MSDLPLELADLAARAAISAHCPTVAVVAANSEAVHDRIDAILVATEAYDVVTTWHTGTDGLEDAIVLLNSGLTGDGPVMVFCDAPSVVEDALRRMGYIW